MSDKTSRRGFIKRTAVGAAALSLAGSEAAQAYYPYGPFKMGLQSYSLRAFDRPKMLALTHKLGMWYLEGFGTHFPMTQDEATLQQYRADLKAAKIKLQTLYVDFGGDAQARRQVFEFAQKLNVEVLVGDPAYEVLSELDALVDEFGMYVAIHNHGPGARYDKIETVLKAMRGHNERIGACPDTGHFMRSDEDPLAATKAFGSRIYGYHIKDLTKDKVFTEIGKGTLDVVGCLEALHQQGFNQCLALEYEEHAEAPVPYIRECLAATRAAVKQAGL